jgi:hypothetical protein
MILLNGMTVSLVISSLSHGGRERGEGEMQKSTKEGEKV